MAWTAPMTAYANASFSAVEFNKHIRDNLLATAPAKATAAGRYIVTTGANAVAERTPGSATVATSETRTSTSYGDLATVGPTVTATTGVTALVFFACRLSNGTAGATAFASVQVSGKTNVPANDNWAMNLDGVAAANSCRAMSMHRFTGLKPGSNTFRMKYRVGTGATTGTFLDRHLVVLPF